jgi:hypothetical protein
MQNYSSITEYNLVQSYVEMAAIAVRCKGTENATG